MAKRARNFLCAVGLAVSACASSEEPAPAPDRLYLGLSEQSVRSAESILQTALETKPSNHWVRWQNEDGVAVTVTLLRTFKIQTGHYCRDYKQVVAVGTLETSDLRRACREKGGTWIKVPLDPAQTD